jgi:predicted SprT family Zn-dependent metalloprotease
MNHLDGLLNEILDQAISAGVPITKSNVNPHVATNHKKTALGECWYHNGKFNISISVYAIDGLSEKQLKDVVAHEVLHCARGCYNHGREFHYYARTMAAYGYLIDTKADEQASGDFMAAVPAKYRVYCPNCGLLASFHRNCKTLNSVRRLRSRCAKCGSYNLTIEEN